MQNLAGRLRGAAAALLLAAGALLGACRAPAATDVQAPSAMVAPGPALWRLADADSEIWLFGTVHILPPELQWRSERVTEALQGADVIYFETPTDERASREVGAVVQKGGLNPPGVTLTSQLDPAAVARLKRVAGALGVDLRALEPARPWLAGLQLSLAYVRAQGQRAEAGVEKVLTEEAKALGKPIRYFETPTEQIGYLAGLSPASERQFLVATLRQIEEDAAEVDRLDDAWARGELAALEPILEAQLREAGPEAYGALISARNARWASEIEKLMAGKGKIFVAVGAAHLMGPDSLAKMLRDKGFTVEGP